MELPPLPDVILETATPANRAPGLERREPSGVKKVRRREQRQGQSESRGDELVAEEQDRHTFDTRA